jgi:hypothetical protein
MFNAVLWRVTACWRISAGFFSKAVIRIGIFLRPDLR